MTIYVLTVLLVLLGIVTLFLSIRNQITADIRIAYIHDPELWPTEYKKLPSYEAMLYHPRYYLLWTKAAWIKHQATPAKQREAV